MEGRDLVLTGKPFTTHKYKDRNRPAINANWLPTRVIIPTGATHEPVHPSIMTSRGRSKDKSSVKHRTRPHSANVPGRKSSAATRPATGLSAPVEHTTLLSARDSKHSARIDLRTAQAIDTSLFTTTSEPYLIPTDNKSISKTKANDLRTPKSDSEVTSKDISDSTVHKDGIYEDKQTISAIKIQRWYRRIRTNRLESGQKLVQELLQQKKDDLNKSRIAELEKVEAQVCMYDSITIIFILICYTINVYVLVAGKGDLPGRG